MPPLKEVKTLLYLSQTALASWYSLALFHQPESLKIDLFDFLPQNCAEELSFYILQAAFGVIHHNCSSCDQDLDDQVLISESCFYLNNVLKKLLSRKSRFFDVNFDIDMRKFANFKPKFDREFDQNEEIDLEQDKILLTEQLVTENQAIFEISDTICGYINGNLEVFNPGLFVIDRQTAQDDYNEPHKISLVWNQPQLLINLGCGHFLTEFRAIFDGISTNFQFQNIPNPNQVDFIFKF